jgi:hypothetical protein
MTMRNATTSNETLTAIPGYRGSDPTTARDRVMRDIGELGLEQHVLELETVGYTTLKRVLSPDVIARA